MRAILRAGVLWTAVVWAAESIALEPKHVDSLPVFDLNCYIAQSVAFTTVESTGGELGISGDNYGKPVYRFSTVGGATLKVVEFPEFESMRKEYDKRISELRFDNSGSDYIFGWSDNEAMGLRIFVINQRDKLVSVLEVPPGAQKLPFGTLRVLKCDDAAKSAPSLPEQQAGGPANPVLDRALWRASKAKFPRPLTVKEKGSVSPRSSSRLMVLKAPPPNGQAAR
jgi:hypothetical protein